MVLDTPDVAPLAEDEAGVDEDGAAPEDTTITDEEDAATPEDEDTAADDEAPTDDEDAGAVLVAATDEEDARELPDPGAEVEVMGRLVATAELPADEDVPTLEAPPELPEEDGPASASPVLEVQARFHITTRQQPRHERMRPSAGPPAWDRNARRATPPGVGSAFKDIQPQIPPPGVAGVVDVQHVYGATLLHMKHGARNQITGKVTTIKKGGVMCQVEVAIPGGFSMTSVMTLDSLKDLGLRKGSPVKVLVKAVNVLLATDA